MRFSLAHKPVILLTLLSLLASVLSAPLFAPPLVGAARAQDAPSASAAQVSAAIGGAGNDTVITYDAGTGALTAAGAAQHLPTQRYGGYLLPMQLFVLQAGSAPQVEIQQVAAADLADAPQPAAAEVPTALGWEPDPNYAPPAPALPTQPVFIARQGAIHGRQIVVVAVSPVYSENGVTRIASHVQATVTGAAPIDAAALLSSAGAAEAAGAQTPVQVPVNAAALTNSYKLTVASAGLQEVLYSDLGLTGEPAGLHLTLAGADIPVERASDRLRFYAPQVGDRWNKTTAYWLTLEAGPTMASRAASVETASVEAASVEAAALGAYEQGEWRDNRLYEPGYPGADGDHWFHVDLKAPAALSQGSAVTQTTPVTVPVATTLPLRSGASAYGVIATGYKRPPASQYCDTPYQLHVQGLNGAALAETRVASWLATPGCQLQTTGTATFSSDAPLTSLLLRLNPNGTYETAIKLEAVTWRRPVELDFQAVSGQGLAGAEFYTDGGAGAAALRNLPAFWRLYDVTQPSAPQTVAAGAGGSYTLHQAAGAAPSRYLLANLLAPQKPAVQAHGAVSFGGVKAADAIYIGPAAFADELAPLLDLRRQQGYTPVFVDVQAIYDVYGYGQVSAAAIRNFLRAESDWQNAARQVAVVLAGDASLDPFAYAKTKATALAYEGFANDTLVAAWIAEVDPYLGTVGHDAEAACDACIAQLNGDDPITGDNQSGRAWFAADVWLGRLPVRNEEELKGVVAKLVAYDTSSDTNSSDELWRMRKVFLADNYINAVDGQLNARPDDAGDFAAFSDSIVNMLPHPIAARRIYYDPAPNRQLTSVPASGGYYQTTPRLLPENWRISDIIGINSRVISTLSRGAGLVVYNGHSNHFYFARTEDVYNTGTGDKWLLNAPEVSLLSNAGKEFVMLSMTCYTSQFVKPTANGTLDEWLIRSANGGAVAVWGPTGLSVVSGHELLQRGFMQQLLTAPGEQRVGGLLEAGYTNLLTNNGPLDPLMTFVLLGDPLTRARISKETMDDLVYLPAVRR